VDAKKRGVRVEAILDRSQRSEKYTSATFLANNQILTYIDSQHAIAHHKVMIVDKQVVITGSFNFTKAAEERNAENLLIIASREMARYYLGNWLVHRKHSEPYRSRY
jgi:phosphatidylserine/phosphatidylglycerophosphate/cardiolipin synthase-like enzyme